MTEQDQIRELAILDGWTFNPAGKDSFGTNYAEFWQTGGAGEITCAKPPDYLGGYNLILPLIRKLFGKDKFTKGHFIQTLRNMREKEYQNLISDYWHIFDVVLLATPKELCEAVLKATEKWKYENA